MFPKESHGYRAKETILHLIWEQDQWLETHVKNKKKDSLELKLNLKDNHLTGKNNIFIYYKTIRLSYHLLVHHLNFPIYYYI